MYLNKCFIDSKKFLLLEHCGVANIEEIFFIPSFPLRLFLKQLYNISLFTMKITTMMKEGKLGRSWFYGNRRNKKNSSN